MRKQWFLVSLVVCFGVGYLGANHLQALNDWHSARSMIVFSVLWAMGVTLRPDSIRRSIARPLPSLLAIGSNIFLVPLLCLPAMWVLPQIYAGGLFVAAIVPCTLASASVWTRKAGGDDSIAMMTTVITNLACVVVVPVGIWLVLSQQTQIDIRQQIQKLSMLVLLPLVLAQLMRRNGLASWADDNKRNLSVFTQVGILSMVLFGAIASAERIEIDHASEASTWGGLLGLTAATSSVHLIALYLGVMAARLFRANRASQIAVGMAGSQKTLMVGLQIAIDCSVSVVPMLVYHLCQLFLDTIIAERWKRAS